MRTFELLLTSALFPYLMWLSFGNGLPTSNFRWLPILTIALVVVHWIVEGVRWQMFPVYFLVILVLASYPWYYSHQFRVKLTFIAVGCGLAFLLLAATAVAGGILWPVFEFAPLHGPYPVGVTSAHLIDDARKDPYSPSSADARELMVEVWYPAEKTAGFPLARYRDGRRSDYKDSSLALVNTRSFLAAPIARTQPSYPVLLFSGPLNRFQNTFETEEMASQGFIVVAIDHPYDSDLVVFPSGRRIAASKEASSLLDFTSDDALEISRKRVEKRLAVRVADASFVLDQLAQWNNCDRTNRFFAHLDLNHIGMLGHSFGGAVTAEMCRRDPRVRAGVNMDGSIFGTVKFTGVPKPFFFMFDRSTRPRPEDFASLSPANRREAHELAGDFADVDRSLHRYGGYFSQVPGFEHMNFTDVVLYTQVKAWSGAGTINIRRAHEITNRMTLAFLRRELLNDSHASVEKIANDYPEAVVQHQTSPAGVTGDSQLKHE